MANLAIARIFLNRCVIRNNFYFTYDLFYHTQKKYQFMRQSFMLLCVLALFPASAFAKKTGDSTVNLTISFQNIISLQPYRLFGKMQKESAFFPIASDTQITILKVDTLTPFLYFFAQNDNLSTDTITLQPRENYTLQFTGIKEGKLKYISAESIESKAADSLLQVLQKQNQKAGNTAWYRRNEILISLALVLIAAFLIWTLYKRKKR